MPEPRPHPPPLPPCSLLEATATMATCSTLQQQPTIAPKLLPQDHNQNQNQNHNHNQNQNQNHSHSHSHNHQQSKAAGGRGRGGGGDREILKCPRCSSLNTKFCYYNNYNLSQPRHFCKACKRYWTKGGSLRNVPVGGRCRKMKTMLKPSNPNEEDQPTPPVSLSSMLASGVVPNDIDPRGRQQQHSSPGFMNLLLNGGRFDPAASVVYNSQHPFQPLEQLLDRRRMTESATFFAPIEGQFRDSDCGELRDEMGNNPYSLSGYHCHLQSPSPTPSIICDPMVGTAMTKPANTVAIDWHQGESSLLCGDLSTPLDNYWTGLSHFSLGQGPFP